MGREGYMPSDYVISYNLLRNSGNLHMDTVGGNADYAPRMCGCAPDTSHTGCMSHLGTLTRSLESADYADC